MGRLIDADAAIDALLGITAMRNTIPLDSAIFNIKKLPSAQSEPHWIPCSERLPEEGEAVLTQAKFKDDVKMAVSSRIDYNYWTGWGTRDINIIAWMSLPEPWKGEEDEAD